MDKLRWILKLCTECINWLGFIAFFNHPTVCDAGYGIGEQFNGYVWSECQPCLQGGFKSSKGNTDCPPCFFGQDTAGTGSTSFSQCCKLLPLHSIFINEQQRNQTELIFSENNSLDLRHLKSESDITSRWIHREFNLMFTLGTDKYQKQIRFWVCFHLVYMNLNTTKPWFYFQQPSPIDIKWHEYWH